MNKLASLTMKKLASPTMSKLASSTMSKLASSTMDKPDMKLDKAYAFFVFRLRLLPISEPVPMATEETSSPPPDVPSGDGRADLMAAIRNAGGAGKAKLKNAKERKQRKKEEKEKTSGGGGGGDLMGDLFAKLQMRRKGISGSRGNKSEETGGGSAMDKISAMIPPPTDLSSSLPSDGGEWEP